MSGDAMGIGEFAAAVGLSVSALRFYARSGVLTPAEVDSRTGYRRYGEVQVESGRLVASLRRVGVGVSDLRRLINQRGDAQVVSDVLSAHLQGLEAGLMDARQELDRIRAALVLPQHSAPVMGSGSVSVFDVTMVDFARAVDAVIFALPAAGDDPELNMVVFELADETLTLFATDRFRLASCSLPVLVQAGEDTASFAVAATDLPGLHDLLQGRGTVKVQVTPLSLMLVGDDAEVVSVALSSSPIPELRQMMASRADTVLLWGDSDELLSTLSAPTSANGDGSVAERVAYIAEDPDLPGGLRLVSAHDAERLSAVAVNADYLYQAIKAGPSGSVNLSVRGQHPLAVCFGSDPSTMSILMPRRD